MIWDSSKPSILPPSWVWTTVGTIYDLIGGGTPSTKTTDYWKGDVPWITSADIHGIKDIRPRNSISLDAVKESATNLVPAGSLVVVTRVGLGKMAIADRAMCFSQDCQALVLQDGLMDRYYSLHYLSLAVQIFKYRNRGTTIGGVTTKQLRDLAFPLAPLPEQHRIVERLENIFSELDKGIERLHTAREQLKTYRQAVLKHAFKGKFTEKWRKEHASELESAEVVLEKMEAQREQRYQRQVDEWKRAVKAWEFGGKKGMEPTKPPKTREVPPLTTKELAELPELPVGWLWIRANTLFEYVTSGSRGWAKYYSDEGAVFIRITNLNFDTLRPDLSEGKIQHVRLPDHAEGKRTRINEGDFLFSITGYLGMFAIAPYLAEAYVNQHVALARPLEGFRREYVGYFIISKTGGHYYLNKLTKGAVKDGLRLDDIQYFPLPFCSLNEQDEIVQQIESRLSIVEQLERTIDDSLQKAEALRQSILKRAFEGKLVPEDPNDEPASVLLERIKAEKAKQREKQGKTKK